MTTALATLDTDTTNSPAADESLINGIDTSALRAFTAEVEEDPGAGMAGFQVRTQWTGGTTTRTDVDRWSLGGVYKPRGYTISTDEPRELCGRDTAANPQEVLMAGLNACMTVGYVAVCSLLGITIRSLEIRTEGTLDLRGFLGIDPAVNPGYNALKCRVFLDADATDEQLQRIHTMVKQTSPNFANLTRAVPIVSTLVAA
ncbi:MAG: OsmC family protein [Phycisphaeraceae bacterium]|nr:OsmC family protein [Phycisphaeraceae bacterium]